MVQAKRFVFDRYEIDSVNRELRFYYKIIFEKSNDEELVEKWVLPKGVSLAKTVALERTVKAIHLAAGISYFKTFLPPEIETSYSVTEQEAKFWNKVYENGLGEFCYINQVTKPLAKFVGQGSSTPVDSQSANDSCLIGIGGGKDSIVAAELLLENGLPLKGFVLSTGDNHGQSEEVGQAIGVQTLGINRYLDTRIIALQKSLGGLNGHVPISVMFALSGVLLAALTESAYVAVGNEAASSIPNLHWNGRAINHQWSKSFEFEELFQNFVHQNISPNITYFSAIRPLSSVGVVKLFSKYPRYFEKFTSCNRVFRIDPAKRPSGRWCGQCDKCLSSFLLFAPWVSQEQLVKIFGKNLLDDESLGDGFLALLELKGHKPLDCVGTPEEIRASLAKLTEQGKFSGSKLLTLKELRKLPEVDALDDFLKLSDQHAIPDKLSDKLLPAMQKELDS